MIMNVRKNDTTTIMQNEVVIPDLGTIKDLLSVIPPHCFKRSTFRSSLYLAWDCIVIGSIYKIATSLDGLITPETIFLPHPLFYPLARFSLWSLYGFWSGLFATGLWPIGHECSHLAFSDSKLISHSVGWILYSALGTPYFSWRITHAMHHASTNHMTREQTYIPRTRSELGLPSFDPTQENILGSSVSDKVKRELLDVLGDSPISTMLHSAFYLLMGLPLYLTTNASGQKRYPWGTNHFDPNAVIFTPRQYRAVIISDIGIFLWVVGIFGSIYKFGFWKVFRIYLVPYLWVNHWVVLFTFLQHTDPILPHYRSSELRFPRGALSTLDRSFMGDCGKIMSWIGAHATNGVCETHVLHHVSSKIPHYNAWEASDALHRHLKQAGINLKGAPVGWREMYRVFKECKFVEDEGDIVFYKNAYGLAASKPKVVGASANSERKPTDSS